MTLRDILYSLLLLLFLSFSLDCGEGEVNYCAEAVDLLIVCQQDLTTSYSLYRPIEDARFHADCSGEWRPGLLLDEREAADEILKEHEALVESGQLSLQDFCIGIDKIQKELGEKPLSEADCHKAGRLSSLCFTLAYLLK